MLSIARSCVAQCGQRERGMHQRLAAWQPVGDHIEERADEQAAEGGEDDGQGHDGAGR